MILKLVNLQKRNLLKIGLLFNKNYACNQKFQTIRNNLLHNRQLTSVFARENPILSSISIKTSNENSNHDRKENFKNKSIYWTLGAFGFMFASMIKTVDCESRMSSYKFVSDKRKQKQLQQTW
jgi:hypothetical protein